MPESQYGITAVLSVGEENSSVTWTSATTEGSAALLVNNDYSYNTLIVALLMTDAITSGQVGFFGSIDGVNFFPMEGISPGTNISNGTTYNLEAVGGSPPETYVTFEFNLTAVPYFQLILSEAIVGDGSVAVSYAADSFVDTTSVTVRYNTGNSPAFTEAPINISSIGDNVIVSGVAGQKIRVFRIFGVQGSPTGAYVTPKDGVSGTAFTGTLYIGSFALDLDAEPWFTTSAGNAFVLNLETSAQVSGRVYFTQS